MKKTAGIFIALLFIASRSIGQDCKFNYNTIDPVTGKQVVIMTVKVGFALSVGFRRVGDDLFVESNIVMPGEQHAELPAGSMIQLKLGNDSVLTLLSKSAVMPVVNTNGGNGFKNSSYNQVKYILSHDDAAKLMDHGVRFCRVLLKDGQAAELSMTEKDTERSKANAKCIFK